MARTANCHPERRHYGHGKCRNCWANEYKKNVFRVRHPGYDAARSREYRYKNIETRREAERNRRTGITSEQRTALFITQSGKCAICLRSIIRNSAAVDHNHETRAIRGLLWRQCNTALGLMSENPQRLRDAAQYLEKP